MCQHWPATKHGCGCPSTRATVLRCHLAWPLGKPCPPPLSPSPPCCPLPPSPPKHKDSVKEPARLRELQKTKCWSCQTEGNISSLATGFHTLDVSGGMGREHPKGTREMRERRRLWADESLRLEAWMPKLPWQNDKRQEDRDVIVHSQASDAGDVFKHRREDDNDSLDSGWDDRVYEERRSEVTWPKKASTKARPDGGPESYSIQGWTCGIEPLTGSPDALPPLADQIISTPETLLILETSTRAMCPSPGPSASISQRASVDVEEAPLRSHGALLPPLSLGPPALSMDHGIFQPRSRIHRAVGHVNPDSNGTQHYETASTSPVGYEDRFPWAVVSPRAVRPGTLSDVSVKTEPFPAF